MLLYIQNITKAALHLRMLLPNISSRYAVLASTAAASPYLLGSLSVRRADIMSSYLQYARACTVVLVC